MGDKTKIVGTMDLTPMLRGLAKKKAGQARGSPGADRMSNESTGLDTQPTQITDRADPLASYHDKSAEYEEETGDPMAHQDGIPVVDEYDKRQNAKSTSDRSAWAKSLVGGRR